MEQSVKTHSLRLSFLKAKALLDWFHTNDRYVELDEISPEFPGKFAEMCADDACVKAVMLDIFSVGKSKLKHWEFPRAILLVTEQFTPGDFFYSK